MSEGGEMQTETQVTQSSGLNEENIHVTIINELR